MSEPTHKPITLERFLALRREFDAIMDNPKYKELMRDLNKLTTQFTSIRHDMNHISYPWDDDARKKAADEALEKQRTTYQAWVLEIAKAQYKGRIPSFRDWLGQK
jgi:hypothetical protein